MMLEKSFQYNLALTGSNIQHSKSPAYYASHLKNLSKYELIDVITPKPLDFFRLNFVGLNITAPFKRTYSNQVEKVDIPIDLEVINTIVFLPNKTLGTNTDYLALLELLPKYIHQKNVIILGDGVMSEVISKILNEKKSKFEVFSRKMNKDFYKLDFSRYDSNTILINTCLRDFKFEGIVPKHISIFDLNYSETDFIKYCKENKLELIDGAEFFATQASYAIKFFKKHLKIE